MAEHWIFVAIKYSGEVSMRPADDFTADTYRQNGGKWECQVNTDRLVVTEWTGTRQLQYNKTFIIIHEDLVKL